MASARSAGRPRSGLPGGLPALAGTTPTIQFLTSGLGLLAFILYLPGGLAEILQRFGDLVTGWIARLGSGRGDGDAGQPDSVRGIPSARGARRVSVAEPTDGRRGPARLEVRGATVSFGGIRALDGVDLVAEPGTIVGLIGPNGSGKTTLLNVISGLVHPGQGTVLHRRRVPRRVPGRAAGLGGGHPLVPGLPALPRSHRGGRPARRPRCPAPGGCGRLEPSRCLGPPVRAVETVRGRRHHRIVRDRTIPPAPDSQLSTGTRRVVDLASIVLAHPRLLLLDEPTAGIAHREAEAFVPLLPRLATWPTPPSSWSSTTCPWSSRCAPMWSCMESGRVVSSGTPDEVAADPRAVAAYLGASEEALAVSGSVGGRRSGPGGHGRAEGDVPLEGDPVGDA